MQRQLGAAVRLPHDNHSAIERVPDGLLVLRYAQFHSQLLVRLRLRGFHYSALRDLHGHQVRQ